MTIRTRLTLWFTGVLLLSLLAMGMLAYHELVVEPRNEPRRAGGRKKRKKTASGKSSRFWPGAAYRPWRWA